jgi:hypothetical protein
MALTGDGLMWLRAVVLPVDNGPVLLERRTEVRAQLLAEASLRWHPR